MREPDDQIGELRSGFVAILGRPNVGKSTLLNRVLGTKVAAVTPKPQTTRNRIIGVLNREGAQLILVDTPGFHQARDPLNRQLVRTALSTLADVDVVLLLVEPPAMRGVGPGPGPDEQRLLKVLDEAGVPVVLAVNKVDLVREKTALLPVLERWNAAFEFAALHPISALDGDGTEALLDDLAGRLPPGPQYYPEEMYTDAAERFLVAEIVREKLMLQLEGEVPYGIAVEVEEWCDPEAGAADPVTEIRCLVIVERKSQKGIVIGKRGARIREVGRAARKDIERLLGTRVYLETFVRVDKDWSRNARALKRLGYS